MYPHLSAHNKTVMVTICQLVHVSFQTASKTKTTPAKKYAIKKKIKGQ